MATPPWRARGPWSGSCASRLHLHLLWSSPGARSCPALRAWLDESPRSGPDAQRHPRPSFHRHAADPAACAHRTPRPPSSKPSVRCLPWKLCLMGQRHLPHAQSSPQLHITHHSCGAGSSSEVPLEGRPVAKAVLSQFKEYGSTDTAGIVATNDEEMRRNEPAP